MVSSAFLFKFRCKPGSQSLIDGNANDARFGLPYGITIDSQGNLYVADYDNNAIRKISFE